MSVQTINGSLPQFTYMVLNDQRIVGSGNPASAWSTGKIVASPLSVGPSLTEKWVIYGFSLQAYMGIQFNGIFSAGTQSFGKLGQLWAGVMVDNPAGSKAWAETDLQIPTDLSLFTQVWDGSTDPVRRITQTLFSSTPLDLAQFQAIYSSYQFPQPVEVRAGSQLGFGAFLTPSLWGSLTSIGNVNPDLLNVILAALNYSIHYEPSPL